MDLYQQVHFRNRIVPCSAPEHLRGDFSSWRVILLDSNTYYYYWLLLYSAILRSQADSLRSHLILHEWIAFYSAFLNIHRSGVLTALAWLVPHESAARDSQSRRVLCTPYNHAPCHFMQSHIRKVFSCLAVTCHLRFWQNDRGLLRATAVTRNTEILDRIIHEIFNRLMTITRVHQVIAFSCRVWRKSNSACKSSKSKMKALIVRCSRNQLSIIIIITTGHGKASPFQPWWSVRGLISTFEINLDWRLPRLTFT